MVSRIVGRPVEKHEADENDPMKITREADGQRTPEGHLGGR
jgi:hypothetical protein